MAKFHMRYNLSECMCLACLDCVIIGRAPYRAVGETGASCYNFHSKSIFHKNMQARDFF